MFFRLWKKLFKLSGILLERKNFWQWPFQSQATVDQRILQGGLSCLVLLVALDEFCSRSWDGLPVTYASVGWTSPLLHWATLVTLNPRSGRPIGRIKPLATRLPSWTVNERALSGTSSPLRRGNAAAPTTQRPRDSPLARRASQCLPVVTGGLRFTSRSAQAGCRLSRQRFHGVNI